jgi:flagellar motor switch protein FliG
MSKRAVEILKDDISAKGPVRLSDVEAAQKEISLRCGSRRRAPSRRRGG